MRILFKLVSVFLLSGLSFAVVQDVQAQKVDTQKVVKTKTAKKKANNSLRDSLRKKQLQRDAMIRTFKHSDGALNDLLNKIELYTSSYVDINSEISTGFDTLDMSQRLPAIEKRLAVMKTTIEKSGTMGYIVTIRDMIDHLTEQTDQWQEQINTYNDALDTVRSKIYAFNNDTTLKVIPTDSALMVKCFLQIQDLKQKWKAIDLANQKGYIRIGKLADRVSALSILLIDLDNKVDLKIHQFALNTLTNEYGYLWDMSANKGTARLDSAIVQTSKLNANLYKYFFISRSNYWPHAIGILLLIVFFAWIFSTRRRLMRTKDEHKNIFDQIHYVVKYPYFATLVVVSVVAPYFYDHPAQIFAQTMLFIMMIALGPLIKSNWPKPLYNLWIALLPLALLFTISNLMIFITNADRLLVLLLSAVAIYVSLRLLKHLKGAPETYPPYLGLFVKIFIGLHALSIILNVFGRFSLAKIIGATATFNLCLAMGLYVLVQVLMEGLFLQLESNKKPGSLDVVSFLDFKVLQKKFKDILIKIAGILWLVALAKNLTIDDYLFDEVKDLLTQQHTINTTPYTYGQILLFFFVIWLSGLIAQIISYFYDFSAQQQTKLTPQAKKTRSSILLIRLTIFTAGFFIAIVAAGIPMSEVTLVIGALGVGIGFGLQNIVNNLVSGFILAFEKPVQIGDVIEIGGRSGTIKEIGIRSSKINIGDGSELIIPNGELISQQLINWTLTDNNRRIELIIKVEYGTDLLKAEEILKDIINNHDDVMKAPAPSVFVHNFSDTSVDFRLFFWAEDINNWLRLKSSVLSKIYSEFAKQGIEILHGTSPVQVLISDEYKTGSIKKADKTPPALPDKNG
ncbi:mechanosensitive ion channel domain-containing protein [uncultured Mucilaginibacter sp.]|uniref:mechanosensitive ion channel family protein n=1 Tax=uncultured Mucilaginibacter sp. TaxID=797541 RepID=UPI0025DB0AC2|nr:mechanosensitive ion channel domain-containing protein [uncultured Mucilaginibacter sp.]